MDLKKREKLPQSSCGSGRVWRPVFFADGNSLAAYGVDGAWWWRISADLSPVATLLTHPLDVRAARFQPGNDGAHPVLITACSDRVLRVWDLQTTRPNRHLRR